MCFVGADPVAQLHIEMFQIESHRRISHFRIYLVKAGNFGEKGFFSSFLSSHSKPVQTSGMF